MRPIPRSAQQKRVRVCGCLLLARLAVSGCSPRQPLWRTGQPDVLFWGTAQRAVLCRGRRLVWRILSLRYPRPNTAPNQDGALVCQPVIKPATLWIGILVTLVGAATLNVGLNIQKLALRKRHEGKLRKTEHDKIKIVQHLAMMRSSFANLLRSVSNQHELSVPTGPPVVQNITTGTGIPMLQIMSKTDAVKTDVDIVPESQGAVKDVNETNSILSPPTYNQTKNQTLFQQDTLGDKIPSGQQNDILAQDAILSNISFTQVNNNISDSQSTMVAPMDSDPKLLATDDLFANLNMASLLKNPIWILGFIVFMIGNILNVVALQFAPQSLVAPLGSISLVVNVICAPLLNHEVIGWTDIVGVIMIVGGSVLVVAFSGGVNGNYCLAVLMVLFKRAQTIAFLTIICFLLLAVFCFIMIVEKNLEHHVDNTVIEDVLHDSYITGMEQVNEPVPGAEEGIVISICGDGSRKKHRVVVAMPAEEDSEEDYDHIIGRRPSVAMAFSLSEKENIASTKPCAVDCKGIWSKWKESYIYVLFSSIKLIPRLSSPIPRSSFYVETMLPFSYASLGVCIFVTLGVNGNSDCSLRKSYRQPTYSFSL